LSGVDPEPRLHQHIKIPDIQPDLTQFLLHQLTFSGCDAATRGQVPAGYLSIYRPRLKTLVSHLTGFYRFSKRKIVGLFFEVLGTPNSLGLVCKHQARTTLANVAGMAEMDCRIMYSAEPKNVGRKRTEGLREAAVCMGGQFHFGGEIGIVQILKQIAKRTFSSCKSVRGGTRSRMAIVQNSLGRIRSQFRKALEQGHTLKNASRHPCPGSC
jgi:hypothetical protein